MKGKAHSIYPQNYLSSFNGSKGYEKMFLKCKYVGLLEELILLCKPQYHW